MITRWCMVPLLYYGYVVLADDSFRFFDPLPSSVDPNVILENYVQDNGYPFETHHVITEDGYILALHRIPSDLGIQNQRVVLIMHGLLGCSADWVLTGRNRSIAYLLSDNGYDIWLGNSRGTTNSKNHTKFSSDSSQFWDFSWHEMGLYDTPAMIDYILDYTGQKELFYIGFSQGTTQFWILMSLKPEYNKKIKLMSALAPVAYTGHISGLLRPLSFFANMFRGFYPHIGFFELLSNTFITKHLGRDVCQEGAITEPLCQMIIFLIGGYSRDEFDHADLAKYLQFAPAGCSYKQLIHYAMGIQNPGHFRPYDYGRFTNLKVYKQIVPPEYPVEKVMAPVVLYNGLNDWLAHPKDVELLHEKLPNIVEKYTVRLKRLNHFDFVYGMHVRDLVYNHLIEKMNSIS